MKQKSRSSTLRKPPRVQKRRLVATRFTRTDVPSQSWVFLRLFEDQPWSFCQSSRIMLSDSQVLCCTHRNHQVTDFRLVLECDSAKKKINYNVLVNAIVSWSPSKKMLISTYNDHKISKLIFSFSLTRDACGHTTTIIDKTYMVLKGI